MQRTKAEGGIARLLRWERLCNYCAEREGVMWHLLSQLCERKRKAALVRSYAGRRR